MLEDILILLGRLHPLIIHLPIGFIVLGLLIEFNKKNKIEKEMPILFMDELYSGIIPKWLLIRMYMKFYPMDDIVSLPINLLQNNFTMNEIKNNREYSEIWKKFNYEYPEILWKVTAYEVFCVLHKFTLEHLIKMGI